MRAVLTNKRGMFLLAALLIGGLLAAWLSGAFETRSPVTVLPQETIEVDGLARHYRLVIPDSLDGQTPSPMLLVFHGGSETPEAVARGSQLDRLAAAEGFYLVYPQGRNYSWPTDIPAEDPGDLEPDLALFDALCEHLAQKYRVDERRIYVAGISRGAAFVCLLVARRSERIAAAACHSGWLPAPLRQEGIHAQRKCPVLFIAGADDKQVAPLSVRKARDQFQQEGHPAEFLLIEGLGHRWATDRGINVRIWEFLSQHELPEPPRPVKPGEPAT